jgi:hypothetical protein
MAPLLWRKRMSMVRQHGHAINITRRHPLQHNLTAPNSTSTVHRVCRRRHSVLQIKLGLTFTANINIICN